MHVKKAPFLKSFRSSSLVEVVVQQQPLLHVQQDQGRRNLVFRVRIGFQNSVFSKMLYVPPLPQK